MDTLQKIFPSADDLLSTPVEDLAPVLIKLAAMRLQSAGFIPEAVTQVTLAAASRPRPQLAIRGTSKPKWYSAQ